MQTSNHERTAFRICNRFIEISFQKFNEKIFQCSVNIEKILKYRLQRKTCDTFVFVWLCHWFQLHLSFDWTYIWYSSITIHALLILSLDIIYRFWNALSHRCSISCYIVLAYKYFCYRRTVFFYSWTGVDFYNSITWIVNSLQKQKHKNVETDVTIASK